MPSDASGPDESDKYDLDAEDREFIEQKEAAVQEIEDEFECVLIVVGKSRLTHNQVDL